MNTHSRRLAQSASAALALGAMLACATALAADKPAPTSARALYEQERAVCLSGQSNQDRATCLREAGAAYAQGMQGGAGESGAQLAANASKRCEKLPDADRKDCVARMQGQGTTSGSASSGGIVRELVTREPAALPATTPPAPVTAAPKS